jgi:hypothetical protein
MRIGNIDHVMGYASSIQHRRLGRADVHAPIHLHRVDRDDLGAEVLGEM